MKLNTLIKKRYSPRAFSDQEISKEDIESLFEAARWSASARNEQPWRFIYGQKGDENYPLLFDVLNDWNQAWAQSAPMLVVNTAKENYDHKGIFNEHAAYDLGQAVAYFTLQATHLGLYVHQMGGFEPEKAKINLNLPNGYKVMSVMAVGYKGELDRIPKEYQEIENGKRERLTLENITSNSTFNF